MERWTGRVAMVTGASSGIGAAIARELTEQGMKVVGLARRVEKIQDISASLKDAPGKLYALKADITNEEDILAAFKWVKENLGGVDVMVNNAGVAVWGDTIPEGKTADWKQMIDVHVIGRSICTREAIQSMKERGVDDGHIIHINSVAGHSVEDRYSKLVMFTATQFAVTALTEGLRKELSQLKSKIRVTSISPGAVKVESMDTAESTLPKDVADTFMSMPMMKPKDIAEAVIFALSRPPHVQIHELTVLPTGE